MPPPVQQEFSPLVNHGILMLSTTNPYVGANLFISQEMTESGHLYNFLSNRGGPMAIEIIDDYVAPVRVLLFYPGEREAYSADVLVLPGPGKELPIKQWIIRGPYPMERSDFRTLQEGLTSLNGEPIFNYQGRKLRFRFNQNSQGPATSAKPGPELTYPAIVPPVKPTPRPKLIKRPQHPVESKKDGKPALSPTPSIPSSGVLTLDQRALLISQGYADRAPNGDAIHTTKVEGESLAAIVAWYTGSDKHLAAVAQANQIDPQKHLAAGTIITIPSGLVKNWKALTK